MRYHTVLHLLGAFVEAHRYTGCKHRRGQVAPRLRHRDGEAAVKDGDRSRGSTRWSPPAHPTLAQWVPYRCRAGMRTAGPGEAPCRLMPPRGDRATCGWWRFEGRRPAALRRHPRRQHHRDRQTCTVVPHPQRGQAQQARHARVRGIVPPLRTHAAEFLHAVRPAAAAVHRRAELVPPCISYISYARINISRAKRTWAQQCRSSKPRSGRCPRSASAMRSSCAPNCEGSRACPKRSIPAWC